MDALFNYFNQSEIPSFVLCTPNKEAIISLGAAYNRKPILRYNAIGGLEFDFPQSIDNNVTTLSAFDLIKNKMLILVDEVNYYIITECPISTEGAVLVKHVVGQSLESELINHRLTGFSGTYNFYNASYPYGTLLQEMLEYIPTWSIGTIDEDLIDVYREFDVDNSTIYNFLIKEVETAYNCVFEFDTFSKTISAKSISNIGNNQVGITLSLNNLLKSVEVSEFSDEMATVLYCYGGENLDIHNVNPIGTNAIYNFDYYKTTDWMSQSLIDGLDAWEVKVDNAQPVYAAGLTILKINSGSMVDLQTDLVELQNQLTSYLNILETRKKQGLDTSAVEAQIYAQKVKISTQNELIANLQETIDIESSSLRLIVHDLTFTSYLSSKSFYNDVLYMQATALDISKNWSSIYNVDSTAPEFDLNLFNAYKKLIGKLTSNINVRLDYLSLYLSSRLQISPFSIVDAHTNGLINNIIEVIDEEYDILQGIIPNTSITVSLMSMKEELSNYQEIIYLTPNFTNTLYLELSEFIFENTYTNENIIITDIMTQDEIQDQAQDLYDESVKVLARISQPRYEFSGDVANFVSDKQFNIFTKNLIMGGVITIVVDESTEFDVAVLELSINYDDPSDFTMTVSNRIRLNKSNFVLADLLGEAVNNGSGAAPSTGGASSAGISGMSIVRIANPLNNAQISALKYISFGINPPSSYGNYNGVWIGSVEGAQCSFYNNENNYLQWDGSKLLVRARNFTLDSYGNITATSASLSGTISASAGNIGGWSITDTSISVPHVVLSSNEYISFGVHPPTTYGSNIGAWMGYSSGSAQLSLFSSNLDYLKWNGEKLLIKAENFELDINGNITATSGSFSGTIIASAGTIGGNILSASSISSASFVSGTLGKGWNISSTGNAEFQNVIINGVLRSVVFEKDTLSAINGMFAITKTDTLASDMNALDSSTMTISGETTFVVDEVVRMKDGANDEWMLVTSASSAPTYAITRDLAGTYSSNNNPAWTSGTAVVSFGIGSGSKTGFIMLDSSSANSPYIDVYGRNSATYNDYTLHGRYGWLKGITDTSVGLSDTDVWGLYTDNAYIKGTIVAISGNIGGWAIGTNSIKSGSMSYIGIGSVPPTSASSGTGIWLGATGLYGLSSGSAQVYVSASTGRLMAGTNVVSLDTYGVTINLPAGYYSFDQKAAYKFKNSTGSYIGSLSFYSGMMILENVMPGASTEVSLRARGDNSSYQTAALIAQRLDNSTDLAEIYVQLDSSDNRLIEFRADNLNFYNFGTDICTITGSISFDTSLTVETSTLGTSTVGENNLLVAQYASTGGGVRAGYISNGASITNSFLRGSGAYPFYIGNYLADDSILISTVGSVTFKYATSFTESTTFNKKIIVGTNNLEGATYSIADDTATSFTPTNPFGTVWITARTPSSARFLLAPYRATNDGSLGIVAAIAGTATNVTTGSLSGTTGVDGKLTISVHTDGKIYIENRLGVGTISFSVNLFGA